MLQILTTLITSRAGLGAKTVYNISGVSSFIHKTSFMKSEQLYFVALDLTKCHTQSHHAGCGQRV
jgi:hypothetical protein